MHPAGTAAVLVGSSSTQWDDRHRGTCPLLHPRVSLCWSLHLSTKEELSQKRMNEMMILRNTWKESQNGEKKPTRTNYKTDDECHQSSAQCDGELVEPLGSLETAEASTTLQMENTSPDLNSAAQRFTDTRKEFSTRFLSSGWSGRFRRLAIHVTPCFHWYGNLLERKESFSVKIQWSSERQRKTRCQTSVALYRHYSSCPMRGRVAQGPRSPPKVG